MTLNFAYIEPQSIVGGSSTWELEILVDYS